MQNPHNFTHMEFLKAYDAYADALYRHCYFRVMNRQLAEDLVQESFMRAWVYISEGNKVDNLRPFLYRILNNAIIDEVRKRRTISLDQLREEGFEPADAGHQILQKQLEAQDVLKLFSKLETQEREIAIMRFVDDLSPKEIAEVVGMKENAVSVRIHRTLKKLQSFVEEDI